MVEFHCYECAGTAKAKGEKCSTCDGEGNEWLIKSVVEKPKSKSKGKK